MQIETSISRLENYKRELAFIFFSRWRSVMTIALVILVASIAIALFWPPIWGAQGSLLVKAKKTDRNPEILEQTELRQSALTKEDLYSEMEILTSNQVLQLTLKTLEDRGQTQILSELGDMPEKRLNRLKKSLSAQVVPASNIIEVLLTSAYGTSTVPLLDVVFETYISVRHNIFNPGAVSAFVDAQVRRFQQDLESKNKEIVEFLAKSGITAPDLQIENYLTLRRELATVLYQLDAEAIQLKSEIERIERHLSSQQIQLFSFIQVPGIADLSTKLQDAIVERANIGRTYRPVADAVQGYDQSVRKLYEQLRSEVAAYVDSLRGKLAVTDTKIQEFRSKIENIDHQNVTLRQNQLALKALEQQAQVLGKSYETFLERNEQSTLQRQEDAKYLNTYVSILMPPSALTEPVFPKPRLIIPAGLLAGLLIALSLSFLQEYLDHTFKRPEEVERIIGLSVLLSIPLKDQSSPISSETTNQFLLPPLASNNSRVGSPQL